METTSQLSERDLTTMELHERIYFKGADNQRCIACGWTLTTKKRKNMTKITIEIEETYGGRISVDAKKSDGGTPAENEIAEMLGIAIDALLAMAHAHHKVDQSSPGLTANERE